jgi:hypothetical protein
MVPVCVSAMFGGCALVEQVAQAMCDVQCGHGLEATAMMWLAATWKLHVDSVVWLSVHCVLCLGCARWALLWWVLVLDYCVTGCAVLASVP